MDALEKTKYERLRNNLYGILSDVDSLDSKLYNLNTTISNNVSINGKNPVAGAMSKISDSNDTVEDSINNVIYIINSKL